MINLASYSARGFDRGASFFKEAIWTFISNLFFRSPWPFPSKFRTFLLRCFGAKIGRGVVIRSGVHITFPWRLEVGDHVWIGEDVRLLNLAAVKIGSNVCISQQAFLCTGSHDYKREDFALQTKPIEIADSVWIAARAFIAPGVKIGQSCVVGANSVVRKDLPPHSKTFPSQEIQRSPLEESADSAF